jgi:hypothetical protein
MAQSIQAGQTKESSAILISKRTFIIVRIAQGIFRA